ncbi:MAG: hybrid sensor histidine kinase/response regulator, partial [Pseudomonadota bacterium]
LDANRKELQKAFNTAEKELANRRVAEIKLIEADRRKDEFLAMLAHELRNPLAPINLAAQMITLASSDKARIDGATQIICRQVKHITSLLNDLLDVSRVTHGKIILSNQPINLKSVVEEAIEQSRPLIDLLAHRLDVCLLPEDATISGDRTRLVQIVTNLLNNAAKYTPHGGELSAEMLIGMEHITLCIRDNGIGIDAALLPHVFELFTQAPRASDRAQGGLGIGLALVKSLVELHGGTITAHSDGLGKGCQFRLTFPRLIHKSNTDGYCAIAPSLERCDQSLSIIVVDDNIDAADALATLLEALGHRVQVAYCAQEGLKLATSVKPSAMFIDIGLPDMDGHQLAKSLRASQISEDLLLIAFTGYGQTNDQDLSRKAGFDFHFTKPADTIEITRLLHRFAQSMNRGNK